LIIKFFMSDPQTQREQTSLKQLSAVAQARQIRLQAERRALAQRVQWAVRWQDWPKVGGALMDGALDRSRVSSSSDEPGVGVGALDQWIGIETLVQIGEYRSGSDLLADRALAAREQLIQFLQQERHDISPQQTTLAQLLNLGGAPARISQSAASNLN
jgi:hypothetical protein